jgi:hypothetical protein
VIDQKMQQQLTVLKDQRSDIQDYIDIFKEEDDVLSKNQRTHLKFVLQMIDARISLMEQLFIALVPCGHYFGKQALPDGVKFCPSCGTQVTTVLQLHRT